MNMRNMQDAHLLIQGASALVHQQHTGEEWMVTDAMLAGSRIEQLSSPLQNRRCFDSAVFDASNLLLLPGIVDLHGDAFERQRRAQVEIAQERVRIRRLPTTLPWPTPIGNWSPTALRLPTTA